MQAVARTRKPVVEKSEECEKGQSGRKLELSPCGNFSSNRVEFRVSTHSNNFRVYTVSISHQVCFFLAITLHLTTVVLVITCIKVVGPNDA